MNTQSTERKAKVKATGESITVYKLNTGKWADATPFRIGQSEPFANRVFDETELEFLS